MPSVCANVLGLLCATTWCCGCSSSSAVPGDTSQAGRGGSGASAGTTSSSGASAGRDGTGGATGGRANTGGTGHTGGSGGTGGSSGGTGHTGGSGGTGGSLPHVIGNCDGLGAVDAIENITPPHVPGVMLVATDPVTSGTLYIGTDHAGIFKSTNCGADFEKIDTGTNGNVLDAAMNWFIAVKPDAPNVLFASDFGGNIPALLKSTNGGTDWATTVKPNSLLWNNVEYGGAFQWASFDPTNPDHMVLSFHASCLNQYSGGCLGETTDAGETWSLIPSPVGGWAEAASPFVLGPTTLLYSSGHQGGLYYSSDSGKNWERVGTNALSQMYVTKTGTFYMAGYHVNTSTDGHHWSAIETAPGATAIIGDGKRLFVGTQNVNGGQAFSTTSETNPGTWKTISSPPVARPTWFALDRDHHVLYASAWEGGLYRMVTQ